MVKRRSSGAIFPYVLATMALLAAVAGLWDIAGGAGSNADGDRIAVRMDTLNVAGATEARGYGLMKIVNESGRPMAIRLVGPVYRDSRTVLVPSWQDKVVRGLEPGAWTVKYCADSDCGELSHPVDYEETVPDGNLHYTTAVIRFGPSPAEWPAARRISLEDFNAD